jgi:hypothetical protein
MHDDIGMMHGKDPRKCGPVANIRLLEGVKGAACHLRHIGKAGGIGQRVKVHHLMATLHRQPHHSRADEACTACHEKFHRSTP